MATLYFRGHSEIVEVKGNVSDVRRVARTLLDAEGYGAYAILYSDKDTFLNRYDVTKVGIVPPLPPSSWQKSKLP